MDIQIKIGVIIENDDGKVLLIKEKYPDKPHALWNIIKGTKEHGETVFQTAVRECAEEAQQEVELTHSLGVTIRENAEKIRIQFDFLARARSAIVPSTTAPDDELIEEVCWFSREELAAMNPSEFISEQAHERLHDWMSGKQFPLEGLKNVDM